MNHWTDRDERNTILIRGTILSAVSKMVTSGDFGDLLRSTLCFRPSQPFYNPRTTGLIETKIPPVDSAYAISPGRFEYGDRR